MDSRLLKKKSIFLFLVLLIIIFFSNQIIVPHFILFGVIFLDGITAIFLNSIIIIGAVSIMIAGIKNDKKLINILSLGLYPIVINSSINILFTLFFEEDLLGFMSRTFGNNDLFIGYLINQILILIIGLVLIINIKKEKF